MSDGWEHVEIDDRELLFAHAQAHERVVYRTFAQGLIELDNGDA